MKDKEKLLKALANARRLEILQLLKKRAELSVGEIAEKIDLSFRSTSRHLRLLFQAGLLAEERRGNVIEYHMPKSLPELASRILPLLF